MIPLPYQQFFALVFGIALYGLGWLSGWLACERAHEEKP